MLWDWLRSVIRAPWRSLPSKIVSFVFATALVVSIAVAWVSTQSIQSFLREKLDQRFPAVLSAAVDRLDVWYSQRELDIQTFAGSATIRDNVGRLGQGRRGERARGEIEQYLSYVLDQFPQYRSLLLLSAEAGGPALWVGDELDLSAEQRSELMSVTASRVSDYRKVGPESVQLASAPIVELSGRVLSTLHAVIDTRTPQTELVFDELGENGVIYVLGREGEVLMQMPTDSGPPSYSGRPPVRGAIPSVDVYTLESGERVVGSVARYPRFGWTIAVEEPHAQVSAPAVAILRKILFVNAGIVLVSCLFAAQIARSFAKPIQGLSAAALRVANGEPDVTFPAHGTDEIGVLGRTFNEMMERLRRNRIELEENRIEIEEANSRLIAQNQELQRVNEVFHQLSITDDLTKLHNHRFFQDHLPREMKRSARTGEPLCMILIDIDDFKRLNDDHGHSVGDAVLRRTAAVMNQVVREMDLLARYGGEEFALLASQTDLNGAVLLAEKLRLAVSEARFPVVTLDGPTEISITVSIGVAPFRGDEKGFFNDADRALYRAKDTGKDCVVVAEPTVPT